MGKNIHRSTTNSTCADAQQVQVNSTGNRNEFILSDHSGIPQGLSLPMSKFILKRRFNSTQQLSTNDPDI
jgi:hypothetical protein